MRGSGRFAGVEAVAFLFSLTPNVVLTAQVDQPALRWSELQLALADRQISVHMTDGATLEGRYSGLHADTLAVRVTKTSNPAKYPKGETRLPRFELAQINVKRHVGWKGRTIGLIAGGAIAAVAVGTLRAISANETGAWSSSSAGVAAAGGGAAIGIGYLIGWLLDSAGSRPEHVVRIMPDEASPTPIPRGPF